MAKSLEFGQDRTTQGTTQPARRNSIYFMLRAVFFPPPPSTLIPFTFSSQLLLLAGWLPLGLLVFCCFFQVGQRISTQLAVSWPFETGFWIGLDWTSYRIVRLAWLQLLDSVLSDFCFLFKWLLFFSSSFLVAAFYGSCNTFAGNESALCRRWLWFLLRLRLNWFWIQFAFRILFVPLSLKIQTTNNLNDWKENFHKYLLQQASRDLWWKIVNIFSELRCYERDLQIAWL